MSQGDSRPDVNELKRQGRLPADPFEGAVPMAPPPEAPDQAEAEDRARGDRLARLERLAPMPAEWLDAAPPPRPQLLTTAEGDPFLSRGKVGMLVAPGGSGKTQALAQLAVAVATGGCWLDNYRAPVPTPAWKATPPGHVLLALGEEDLAEVQRRVWFATHNHIAQDKQAHLCTHLWPWGLAGVNVGMVDADGNATEWANELLTHLKQLSVQWSLIVLDPLSRWGGPNVELDNHVATRAIELLELLTQLPGAPAVLVSHHSNKGMLRGGKEGQASDQTAARGASALVDGARWVANLERVPKGEDKEDDPKRVRLRVVKTNYGPPVEPLTLAREAHGYLSPESSPEREATQRGPAVPEGAKPLPEKARPRW